MSSPWLDVAVALTFVFFVFSLVVSGINELLNWVGQVRSKQLWAAIARLAEGDTGGTSATSRQVRSRLTAFVYGLRDTFFAIPTGRVDHRPAVDGTLSPSSSSNVGALLSALRGTAALRSLETAVGGRTSIRHIAPDVFADAWQELGQLGDGALQGLFGRLDESSALRRHVETTALLEASNPYARHAAMAWWFDRQMAELSRRYRKDARRVMFALGLGVAVVANLNAINLVASAQRDSDLRQALTAGAAQAVAAGSSPTCPATGGAEGELRCLGAEIGRARSLRVTTMWDLKEPCRNGRPCSSWFRRALDVVPSAVGMVVHHPWAALGRLIGWLVTAIALSFGAAFWFDLLKRLVGYRRTPAAS